MCVLLLAFKIKANFCIEIQVIYPVIYNNILLQNIQNKKNPIIYAAKVFGGFLKLVAGN